jgi:hypothetical protein
MASRDFPHRRPKSRRPASTPWLPARFGSYIRGMANASNLSPFETKKSVQTEVARPEVTCLDELRPELFDPALSQWPLAMSEAAQAAGAMRELFRSASNGVISFRAEIERTRTNYFENIGTSFGLAFASFTENVIKYRKQLDEVFAPIHAERRMRERISDLGFVPHAVLFNHLGNTEKPSDLTISEFSQAVETEVWPKVWPSLQLSQEDCLGDSKIYLTFDQIIRAHDAGLYQLTVPAAFHVIERAARIAQPGPQRKGTSDWLKTELADMTFCEVPSQWRAGWTDVWEVLYEQAFRDCRTDEFADTISFPLRHAAAHGFGAKVSRSVDSMNCVLMAHFVITAAAAFMRFSRRGLNESH